MDLYRTWRKPTKNVREKKAKVFQKKETKLPVYFAGVEYKTKNQYFASLALTFIVKISSQNFFPN